MLHYEGAGVTDEETGKDEFRDSLIWSCVCLVFNQLLTQAAEWKLQAKELKEQHTVMQAQVNIYCCGITHNPICYAL